MIKEIKDIKLYHGERYGFAILIAEAWMNIINGLNKNLMEELKK